MERIVSLRRARAVPSAQEPARIGVHTKLPSPAGRVAGDEERGVTTMFRDAGRARCVVASLLAIGFCSVLVDAGQAASPAAPDAAVVGQRASEAGAWWMIVQTACDAEAAKSLMYTINTALARIDSAAMQTLVVDRIEEPHLDEPSRLRMEAVMKRVAAARQLADEMDEMKTALAGKRASVAALQKAPWAAARSIRTVADLDAARGEHQRELARMCREGTDGVNATLLDAEKGLLKTLR